MTDLSVLDLVPIREGRSLSEAYDAAASLAQAAEAHGYKRFWVAEHHAMEGIGGAAASVVLAYIGHATETIRIGSGGIMLPNHNPFVIAEQFGTLDALFPGRIDLGLGRAPGADSRVQTAFRKNLSQAAGEFPQDVIELTAYFDGREDITLRPYPGFGGDIEMWMLGSSLYGAQLAAALGLPYAFAAHFAPDHLDEALATYRRNFKPSDRLEKPRVMVAMNVFAAESETEAERLASSQLQSFMRLRTGSPGKLPPPVDDYRASLGPMERRIVEHVSQASAVGTPDQVSDAVAAFVKRTQADEIIVAGATYDPQARETSLRLTAEALAS